MEKLIYQQILKNCEVAVEDTSTMSEEEFAMCRRDGLGASDMSAVLGTMDKFRTRDDVLQNKLATTWTEEEQAIGEKTNVKKGKDLEPLILQKAQVLLGLAIEKPKMMYRMHDHPWITVNFDGVAVDKGVVIPIEAKFTSTYADKYWNYSEEIPQVGTEKLMSDLDYINLRAKNHGVPPYYLVQLQVQMLALSAPYGYLVSLRDKTWDAHSFRIESDPQISQLILIESHRLWQQIERLRKGA